jgi:cyclopropane fatty-acyl-phospholipid synthase-like methyltransferase
VSGSRPYTLEEMSAHYGERHDLRRGLYDSSLYANYGYWTREGMTLDEACEAMTDLVADELRVEPGDRLLECGCGYGASAARVARRHGPREILAVDVTEVRLEVARRLIEERGLADRVRVAFGNAVGLDVPDESFDKVMAIECAIHFNTRHDFFREAFRVLRPGGLVALTDIVPARDLDVDRLSLAELRERLCAAPGRFPDENIYSQQTYEAHLREVGFEAVSIRSIRDKVLLPFADCVERAARASEPEARERRLAAVRGYRESHERGGDYVVVRAAKPGPGVSG